MKTYIVYFEFQGKKYKLSVLANSKEQAQKIAEIDIVSKIIYHKIDIEQDHTVDFIKDIFGIK